MFKDNLTKMIHDPLYMLPATCYLLPATCYLLPATRYPLPFSNKSERVR